MDRKIEKKANPLKLILITVFCLVIIYLSFQVYSRSGTTRLKVDPSRMTISQVKYGEFQEYYPFEGEVVPVTTYYLDVDSGGRVEEIYAEEGKPIKKGDPILRFSNRTVQQQVITQENNLLDTLDRYQNTKMNLAVEKLSREETLLQLENNLKALERKYKRYNVLKKEKIVISEEDYLQTIDELEYRRAQLALRKEYNKNEDRSNELQLEQANNAIERINKGLELLAEQLDSLELKAEISGQLSSINAKIGQRILGNARIGWIDVLDKLKINAGIDQYYLAKVKVGTKGKFALEGEKYDVEVIKVYPEVDASQQFRVDMAFVGAPPEGIIRGQTLTTELSFSEPGQSLMVKKGGFYQQTSGRWVYIISEDGKTAHRVDMRLGRQNPRYVEVLEGLKEGDWIITSGYDTFKEADELIFKEPFKLNG
ncbi:MAG: HlyD family efflux transporter periplasmic adaptor subunit [Desulfobacteraceae bacterium]